MSHQPTPTTLLTNRAVILAKLEATPNVDSSPDQTNDAILVADPDFTIDPNVLERNFTRNDLSPIEHVIGRKLAGMSFTTELRSNGDVSGTLGNEAKLARLFRACGYALSGMAAGTAQIGSVYDDPGNTNDPTWATGGTVTNTQAQRYLVQVTTAGASATAAVRVSSIDQARDATVLHSETFGADTSGTAAGIITVNATNPESVTYTASGTWSIGETFTVWFGGVDISVTTTGTTVASVSADMTAAIDADARMDATDDLVDTTTVVTLAGNAQEITITSGVTAVTLGNSGAELTPTWTGNLTLGDSWLVTVWGPGFRLDPVSSGFETITLYAYFDGLLHKITGALGTFTINAEAGTFGTVEFEFTGQYVAVTDAALPASPVFETTLPQQIELAELVMGDQNNPFQNLVVNAFTFDQANNIVPRPDVNNTDGFNGVRITGRAPSGGMDPEAVTEAVKPFWADMANAVRQEFRMRLGTAIGNTIWLNGPRVQLDELGYGNRDGIRNYDVGLKFSRISGNDEFVIIFN